MTRMALHRLFDRRPPVSSVTTILPGWLTGDRRFLCYATQLLPRPWRNWQTRKIQVLVSARTWRFNSSRPQCRSPERKPPGNRGLSFWVTAALTPPLSPRALRAASPRDPARLRQRRGKKRISKSSRACDFRYIFATDKAALEAFWAPCTIRDALLLWRTSGPRDRPLNGFRLCS